MFNLNEYKEMVNKRSVEEIENLLKMSGFLKKIDEIIKINLRLGNDRIDILSSDLPALVADNEVLKYIDGNVILDALTKVLTNKGFDTISVNNLPVYKLTIDMYATLKNK